MKFPYIPLDAIIEEVAGQLTDMDLHNEFERDSAYLYGIETARFIGHHAYEDATEVLIIKNHSQFLPEDFYICNQIWNLKETAKVDKSYEKNGIYYIPDYMMVPGDSATVQLCNQEYRNPTVPEQIISYYFKKKTIRTSFKDGAVLIQYMHLPKNDDGILCVQDEINTILAIKAGIKKGLLTQGFYAGRVANYVYQDVKDDYFLYTNQATAVHAMPDPAQFEYFAMRNNNRYRSFRL